MCEGYRCYGCCFREECQENKRFECIYSEKEPFKNDNDEGKIKDDTK